ncbi:hypothetical protein XENTR_v10004734 [Xenopus tropicalis]|nr:hypothetical protein XENTR_v10004734 [Xenopus tropicalis]
MTLSGSSATSLLGSCGEGEEEEGGSGWNRGEASLRSRTGLCIALSRPGKPEHPTGKAGSAPSHPDPPPAWAPTAPTAPTGNSPTPCTGLILPCSLPPICPEPPALLPASHLP